MVLQPRSRHLGEIYVTIGNTIRLRKVFHQCLIYPGEINHKKDSLQVRKVLQVRCWQLGKINHGVGGLKLLKVLFQESCQLGKSNHGIGNIQILKVFNQGCFEIGKINSRVDNLQGQKMLTKKRFTKDIPTKPSKIRTTCIITGASTYESDYCTNLGNL